MLFKTSKITHSYKYSETLVKLFKDNKQLNLFLNSFQKEIVDSHKEIWNNIHELNEATKSSK